MPVDKNVADSGLKEVTDPSILAKLKGDTPHLKEVTDAAVLSKLNNATPLVTKAQPQSKQNSGAVDLGITRDIDTSKAAAPQNPKQPVQGKIAKAFGFDYSANTGAHTASIEGPNGGYITIDPSQKATGAGIPGLIAETHDQKEAREVKETTDNATKAVAQDLVGNMDKLPVTYQQNLANTSIAQGNVLHDITDPHGNPEMTGGYIQSRIAQLQEAKQKSFVNNGLDMDVPSTQFDPRAQEISKQYDDQIANLQKNAQHIIALQLFNKEYNDPNKIGDAQSQTEIAAIGKQRDAQVNKIQEEIQSKGGFDNMTGYDAQRLRGELSQVDKQYNEQKNAIKNNTKLDAVQLGIQAAKLMGDKGAIADEVRYNNGKPISPSAKYGYQATGLGIIGLGGSNAMANGQDQVAAQAVAHSSNPLDRLEKDNPDYVRQQKIQRIGNYLYKNENPVHGTLFSRESISPEELQDAAKALGYSPKDIKGITTDDIPRSAGLLNQAAQGFVNNAGDLYEGGMRGLALLGVANQNAVNERFAPGWKDNNAMGTAFTGNMPQEQKGMSNWRGVLGQMSTGVGQLGGFFGTAETGGGLLKGTGLLSDAERADKIAQFTTAAIPSYNDAYSNSVNLIGDSPKDEWKRQLYAITNAGISGATMMIDPKADIARDIIGETKAGQEFINTIKNGGLEELTKPALENKYKQILQETTKHLGLQVAIPTVNKVAENMTNMVLDPNGNHHTDDDVAQAAISGAVSMALPSLLSGIMHPRNQTAMNKGLMYEIGSTPRQYMGEVINLQREGKITFEEAQASIGAINKLSDIVRKQVPQTAISGERLSDNQKQDYAFNILKQQELNKRLQALGDNGDESQKKSITKALSESVKINEDILNKAGQEKLAEKPTLPVTSTNHVTNAGENPAISNNKIENDEKSSAEEINVQDGQRGQNPELHQETNGEIRNEQQESGQVDAPADGWEVDKSASQPSAIEQKEEPAAPKKRRGKLVDEDEIEPTENKPIPIVEEPALRAQDLGKLEGKPEVEYDKVVKESASKNPDEPADALESGQAEGESFNEFKDRVQGAWEKIKAEGKDNTVVVTHSSAIKLIEAAEKHGWDSPELADEYKKASTEPGEIMPVKTDDGKNIILTRHGETQDNVEDKLRTKDTPLTDNGREQAQRIGEELSEKGITPSEIITSDYPRAIETAHIIAEEHGNAPQKEEKQQIVSEKNQPNEQDGVTVEQPIEYAEPQNEQSKEPTTELQSDTQPQNVASNGEVPESTEREQRTPIEKAQDTVDKLKDEHKDLKDQEKSLQSAMDAENYILDNKGGSTEKIDALEKEYGENAKAQRGQEQKIVKAQERLKLIQKEQKIKDNAKKAADKIRKAGAKLDKIITKNHVEGEGVQTASIFPGIGDHLVGKFSELVAKGIEQAGNLHIAILRAVEWAKEQGAKVTQKDFEDLKERFSGYIKLQSEEPPIKESSKEYMDDMLDDIRKGAITYDEGRQEIIDAPNIKDATRGKLLNYLDWHNSGREIHNSYTQREEKNQGTALKNYRLTGSGETSEYLSANTLKDLFGKDVQFDTTKEKQLTENIVQDAANMVGLMKTAAGTDDILVWGKEMLSQINNMGESVTDEATKKLLAVTGLHNEINAEMTRLEFEKGNTKDQNRISEIDQRMKTLNKMVGQTEIAYRDLTSAASGILNAAKANRIYRDTYHQELYADRVLNDQERKAKQKTENALDNTKVTDKDAKDITARDPEKVKEDVAQVVRQKNKSEKGQNVDSDISSQKQQSKSAEKSKTVAKKIVEKVTGAAKKKEKVETKRISDLKKGATDKMKNEKGENISPSEFFAKLKEKINKVQC